MNNKVDKLFKDKLEDHSLQPSAHAWEKVEAHLGKKNKMGLLLRIAAGVVLLGVLTFVGLNWKETEKKEQVVSSKEPVVKPEEKREEPVIEKPKVAERKKNKPAPKKEAVPVEVILEEEPVEIVAIVPVPELPKTDIKKEKGITLTYSLPSIKKEEPAVVVLTEDDTKKTGLTRVLEIAREVKNSDSPLGELREAKDDIFALDFRKDKDKKRH